MSVRHPGIIMDVDAVIEEVVLVIERGMRT
jgi:hypothetical protein